MGPAWRMEVRGPCGGNAACDPRRFELPTAEQGSEALMGITRNQASAYSRIRGTPCSSRSSSAMALVSITPLAGPADGRTVSPRIIANALR